MVLNKQIVENSWTILGTIVTTSEATGHDMFAPDSASSISDFSSEVGFNTMSTLKLIGIPTYNETF